MDLLQVIKAISDETRIRILNLLRLGDMCVCELEFLMGINQSNASRHLNKLAGAEIITSYKVAKYVYYKITEETLLKFPFLKEVIEIEAAKLNICQQDVEKLKHYKQKGMSCETIKKSDCGGSNKC